MFPPVAVVLVPATINMFPPTPCPLSPTANKISPPLAREELPVPITIRPESPSDAPVFIFIAPLAAVPSFALPVLISREPLAT